MKKTKQKPIRISGPPVEVGVTMYVLSISSLSEVKMVLTMTSYLIKFLFNLYFFQKFKKKSIYIYLCNLFIHNIFFSLHCVSEYFDCV